MCGLVALAGEVPPEVRATAIIGAAARGPHSHGWATPAPGGWTVTRRPGRLTAQDAPAPGPIAIGHSRLATSTRRPGDAPDPDEGQPLVDAGVAFAHNGTLTAECITDLGQDPAKVTIDSEAILRILARQDRPPGARFALLQLACRAPQALIWADADGLYAGRVTGVRVAAHPLYAEVTRDYAAVSSAPLPAGRLLEADEAHLIWSM